MLAAHLGAAFDAGLIRSIPDANFYRSPSSPTANLSALIFLHFLQTATRTTFRTRAKSGAGVARIAD